MVEDEKAIGVIDLVFQNDTLIWGEVAIVVVLVSQQHSLGANKDYAAPEEEEELH